jgi:PilZ domain-containing protein
MIDRVPVAPATPGPIRLLAVYRSAGSLLRELSRALNQGQTLLKADTGLPAGTRLVLVMTTDALSAPIEVQGVVTGCHPHGRKMAMTLRYDFDPEPHRSRLREATAELRRQTRRPRREPRVPLALRTEATALVRGLSATVSDASRAGARLQLVGRSLPAVASGDRLVMTLAGSRPGNRRPVRLVLEAMWVGEQRRAGPERRQEVGGRFLGVSASLKRRILAILSFDDARPALRLVRIQRTPRRPDSPKQDK